MAAQNDFVFWDLDAPVADVIGGEDFDYTLYEAPAVTEDGSSGTATPQRRRAFIF